MSDIGKQGTPKPAIYTGPNEGGRPVDGDTAPDGVVPAPILIPRTPGNSRKAR